MTTDLSKLAASLTDAIRKVEVQSTEIRNDDGHYLGDTVTASDLAQFRDALADAVSAALRAYLERNPDA